MSTATATSTKKLRRGYLIWKKTNWTIEFKWVKAPAGNYGNELSDHLAKAAACNTDTAISFDRIPKSTLYSEIEEEATQKWQKEWENCKKTAVTKVLPKRTRQD
jgi:hypothetical protein